MTKTPNASTLAPRDALLDRARCAVGVWRCAPVALLALALLARPAAARRHPAGPAAPPAAASTAGAGVQASTGQAAGSAAGPAAVAPPPQTAPAADGDDDGDGVPNLLDRCLYTPPGLRVDDVGCPLEPTRRDDVRLILAAAGGLLILLALGAVRWVRRTREEAAPEEHVPLLLFAPEPGRAPLPPPPPGARPLAPPRPASGPPPAIAVPAGGWPAGAAWPGPGPVPSSPAPLWPEAAAPRPGSFGAPPAPRAGNGGADEPDAAPAADDSTLRLLPGRLELVAGAGDREIRFVQGPSAVTEITVGRQAGPAMRHLQLPAPTVSRLHARLRYEEGRWSIANLSRTNPVVVNGAPLGGAEARAPLREGDRIEVGEYIFIFHER